MIVHSNFEQKSPEWFAIRKGRMSASHAQAIGSNGAGLKTYITELMAEYFSSGEKELYTNKDMDRGNELEPTARAIYDLENDITVKEVGFCEHDEYVGCSPDGLVGEDGGIEIKCVNDVNHFKVLMYGESEIESKYIWQIQMNLLITGRKWWDYISFNPNYKKSLVIFRILPDQEKFKKLEEGFSAGRKMIDEMKKKIQSK